MVPEVHLCPEGPEDQLFVLTVYDGSTYTMLTVNPGIQIQGQSAGHRLHDLEGHHVCARAQDVEQSHQDRV